jgi:indolepyruvate ferredoxin oxidoreductase, beta subunit
MNDKAFSGKVVTGFPQENATSIESWTGSSVAPFVRRASDKPIAVAIMALGGQGGGVLSDWVVALAEGQGWHAQSTSVPGVAQRTGATIYYVEMLPPKDGRAPVLSLMPAPGDVDVVLAAELMEAGRSMLRGLVTPDRTTLIASSHRAYAVVEKEKPGGGIADSGAVVDAAGIAAKRVIAFDMEALATRHGSVVSACLFGGLAASGVLPFGRDAFEAVIRSGGRGIEPSLNAFAAAYDRAGQTDSPPAVAVQAKRFAALPAAAGHPALDRILARIRAFPAVLHEMLYAGAKHLTDFQDPAYADEYLDRISRIFALDRDHGGADKGFALTAAAAKYIAVAMAYDDVIRVAELKTRSRRFARVRREVGATEEQIVYTTEYMHPRVEEVAGTLPKRLGLWLEAHPGTLNWLFRKGRRVRSGTISWFLALYVASAFKPLRRMMLRHAREREHLEQWLKLAEAQAARNYDLAVEILCARRLVKGYADTHARGRTKFDRVIAAVPMLEARDDGAQWLRRLRQAALADENGDALDGALRTIATL